MSQWQELSREGADSTGERSIVRPDLSTRLADLRRARTGRRDADAPYRDIAFAGLCDRVREDTSSRTFGLVVGAECVERRAIGTPSLPRPRPTDGDSRSSRRPSSPGFPTSHCLVGARVGDALRRVGCQERRVGNAIGTVDPNRGARRRAHLDADCRNRRDAREDRAPRGRGSRVRRTRVRSRRSDLRPRRPSARDS